MLAFDVHIHHLPSKKGAGFVSNFFHFGQKQQNGKKPKKCQKRIPQARMCLWKTLWKVWKTYINQGLFTAQKIFACGKLGQKCCQVFFEIFFNSTFCTNRQRPTKSTSSLGSA